MWTEWLCHPKKYWKPLPKLGSRLPIAKYVMLKPKFIYFLYLLDCVSVSRNGNWTSQTGKCWEVFSIFILVAQSFGPLFVFSKYFFRSTLLFIGLPKKNNRFSIFFGLGSFGHKVRIDIYDPLEFTFQIY